MRSTTRRRVAAAPQRLAGALVIGAVAAGVLIGGAMQHLATPPAVVSAAVFPGAPPAGAVTGLATFYAEPFDGRVMADGGRFNMDDPTITASNSWPLGTRLLLRRAPGSPWDATLSPEEYKRYSGRTIVVTVRDRGNFSHALDLSRAAFAQLGRPDEGVIRLYIVPIRAAADQAAGESR